MRNGMEVYYSHTHDLRYAASNIQTQCVSGNMHMTWYGLCARECKAADASKGNFTVFNSSTGKAVAHVDLRKVPLPPIGKSVPLGCVVSALNLALTLPGSATTVVGWMSKGVQLMLSAAGVALSCELGIILL